MADEERRQLKNKIHYMSKMIINDIADQTGWAFAFKRWRAYMDNTVFPTRIESAVILGTLANEQTDLKNKNGMIVDTQKEQLDAIERVVSDFYNKGYTSFRSFQLNDYKINHKQFQMTQLKYILILFAISMTMLGLSLLNKMNQNSASVIIAIIVILYGIYLYLNIQQNRMRRKYEWAKMYYKGPKKAEHCNSNSEYSI
jgi:hypothetical protein